MKKEDNKDNEDKKEEKIRIEKKEGEIPGGQSKHQPSFFFLCQDQQYSVSTGVPILCRHLLNVYFL